MSCIATASGGQEKREVTDLRIQQVALRRAPLSYLFVPSGRRENGVESLRAPSV